MNAFSLRTGTQSSAETWDILNKLLFRQRDAEGSFTSLQQFWVYDASESLHVYAGIKQGS